MIIKPAHLPRKIIGWSAFVLGWYLKRRLNKLIVYDVAIKPNCSYLLMCNHFSFWDGFLGYYLSFTSIGKQTNVKNFYVMVLKKQLQKNRWMRYFGSFSIAPRSPTSHESISFAAEILNTPGNVLLFYPQANLESMHVRHIEIKDGIKEILARTTGNCQLIWSSNLVEYYESLKPSVYCHMLDCGSNKDFEFEKLADDINSHHKAAVQKQFRFTKEK